MAAISPNHAMQDLKITYQQSTLVFPTSQHDQKKSLFLSNIDKYLNFNVQTAHFFRANPGFPPETVAQRLKMALEKVLVPYDFLAGRVEWNHESGRAEIECNAAGAGFVVASSEFSVEELGDLATPNLGFRQLAVPKLDHLDQQHDQPLCIIQVTSFKCGGFAMGMSVNHILFDGLAAKMFLENLASQAFADQRPLAVIPFHDRHVLAARLPPLVTFPHPEFSKPAKPALGLPIRGSKQELRYKILKMSSKEMNLLKAKAINGALKVTSFNVVAALIWRFNVVAALIWRCRALSSFDIDNDNKDRVVGVYNVMDLRSRLNKTYLPREYCGNAILGGYASAKCKEIEKLPFWEMVKMVQEGLDRVTEEYVRSGIDWMEINKGMPLGDSIVSSWLRLGFDQVVFPWGKPVCCVPVVNQLERLCWIFPDGVDGVNVLVQRPAEEMERFRFHFLDFFENNNSK
ncbi:shikimate o-hydroxycinnamoyltransferase [Phtheirospermum japonicum]|uniref:Shikimate o-hydroxycinnamoyltransferase n=1 Tax=Phtheirospermum japonicum TaxID=374723 RepID=A0A830B5H8_9LAMI|nr:shikimate o-hydroxycinnamoyltransferase [Phtheirospermum japonicum]